MVVALGKHNRLEIPMASSKTHNGAPERMVMLAVTVEDDRHAPIAVIGRFEDEYAPDDDTHEVEG